MRYGQALDTPLALVRGAASGARHGAWAVVGVLKSVSATACATAHGAIPGAIHRALPDADVGGVVWSARVARCWMWRVLELWQMLPDTAPSHAATAFSTAASTSVNASTYDHVPPSPLPPASPDTVQWTLRSGVRSLSAATTAECVNLLPRLLARSRALLP